MRTTLDIETDVLSAIKELALQNGSTMGKVMSDLVRKALTRQPDLPVKNGIPQFPVSKDAGVVTSELVSRLLDEAS